MRSPDGYLIITDPNARGGVALECDTVRCVHCHRIVPIKPNAIASDAGGYCPRCHAAICGPCADLGKCTPFEKKLEAMEGRARFLRAAAAADS